jgi:iron complex transport system ATP-binding protein
MADLVLQLSRVAHERNGRRLLDGVGLSLRAGEAAALVGANGAGKTTLLRAAAGLLPAATGEITATGLDPRTAPPAATARRRLYAEQHPSCAWDQTVAELGALADRPAAWADWAGRFALTALAERPLASLSGGERQAAHLARLFASLEEPYGALLLLDEPTAALDRARRETVHAAVQAWAQAGAAVLVATHDAAWARTFPRVVALEEGRLIADGPPAAAFTAELVRAVWGAPAT